MAKRARGIDEYYKNLDKRGVTEAIINESKMEFVAEGKMWWLYLRTNTEFELISTLVGREGFATSFKAAVAVAMSSIPFAASALSRYASARR